MLILAIIVTLLLFGFFAGLEAAYSSMNRFSIELKKKQGRLSGRLLSVLKDQPFRFRGMSYAGMAMSMTLFSLLSGRLLHSKLSEITFFNTAPTITLIVELILEGVVLLLVYFSFTSVFRAKSNQLLSFFIRPTYFFFQVLSPAAEIANRLSNWILTYLFNIEIKEEKEGVVRLDIEQFLQQGKESGEESTELNTELFENALMLPKVKVRQCLVPRKEIVGVEVSTSLHEIRNKFIDTQLSRLIVFDVSIDRIVGYIHQLDLFRKPTSVSEVLHPIPAVPESMGATDLISMFTRDRKSIAWVVDEFGGTSGIVTMEDLLEEIFGEIKDEYDVEEFVEKKITEQEYVFSGRLEIDYLKEKYKLSFKEESESETLSGYIVEHHEKIPSSGEEIIVGNYGFEMLKVSETRIETVKLKILR
jgi:CBS domain containing-hemolysin-like protein